MNKKVLNIIEDFTDLDFNLNDNDELIINFYSEDAHDMNIHVVQNNNSKLVINYSIINKNDSNININNEILGNNNTTVVKLRCIAQDNHANISVCSKANIDTKDNNIEEDLKAIFEQGTTSLKPILEIETSEVMANHFATVKSYDNDELFYLTSKGISDGEAKKLIRKSFIYSLFSEEFIKMIDKGDE